ncbi:hypothetical protein AB0N03_36720, partial [Amycolatopsis sp. NPDC051061]
PALHGPVAGHVGPVTTAGSVSFPPVAAHGGAAPASPGALPATPAFQAVGSGGDAASAGAPPVLPGAAGSTRLAGDHPATGGFMGAMIRGQQGQDEQERTPAGFLGSEPEAWHSGGDGSAVLGRPSAPPPVAGDDQAAILEELKKSSDPGELLRTLGRLPKHQPDRGA